MSFISCIRILNGFEVIHKILWPKFDESAWCWKPSWWRWSIAWTSRIVNWIASVLDSAPFILSSVWKSIITRELERILIEHLESKYSWDLKQFFNSICPVWLFLRTRAIGEINTHLCRIISSLGNNKSLLLTLLQIDKLLQWFWPDALFLVLSQVLARIRTEHVHMKHSWESRLRFESICSIRILSSFGDIRQNP